MLEKLVLEVLSHPLELAQEALVLRDLLTDATLELLQVARNDIAVGLQTNSGSLLSAGCYYWLL